MALAAPHTRQRRTEDEYECAERVWKEQCPGVLDSDKLFLGFRCSFGEQAELMVLFVNEMDVAWTAPLNEDQARARALNPGAQLHQYGLRTHEETFTVLDERLVQCPVLMVLANHAAGDWHRDRLIPQIMTLTRPPLTKLEQTVAVVIVRAAKGRTDPRVSVLAGIAAAGSPFAGYMVLPQMMLMDQTLHEAAERITLYRTGWRVPGSKFLLGPVHRTARDEATTYMFLREADADLDQPVAEVHHGGMIGRVAFRHAAVLTAVLREGNINFSAALHNLTVKHPTWMRFRTKQPAGSGLFPEQVLDVQAEDQQSRVPEATMDMDIMRIRASSGSSGSGGRRGKSSKRSK